MRLAILASHPIQYQIPIFRLLAEQLDLKVFFAHRASETDQAKAGFGVGFEWDIDLLAGYEYEFLDNIARHPGLDHFRGCDTPSISEKLANGNYAALLVMGWHLKCFLQGVWAAKRSGVPVVVRGDSHLETPRGLVKRVAKMVLYPIALRFFNAALYVGQRSRRYWEHYGYPKNQLFFSPHCVDNEWFSERATEVTGLSLRAKYGISQNASVLLFAGKLVPFKRPLDLVSAAELLTETIPNLTVLIAGSGVLSQKMTDTAAEKGVHLVQLGFCNQTEMPAAYAAADILVLPSQGEETWGLVANEALACGLPIVVSDACGCAPDLAADACAGRVFTMGDVVELANAIAELLTNTPDAKALLGKAMDYSLANAVKGIVDAVEFVTLSEVVSR